MNESSVSYRSDYARHRRQTEFISRNVPLCRSFTVREHIIRSGTEPPAAYVLIRGMASKFIVASKGRRQFTALLLPGDLIGLESLLKLQSPCNVTAMTETVCQPLIASDVYEADAVRLLWEALERQTLAAGEWMMNLGKRAAVQRMAYFFHETLLRMQDHAMGNGPQYQLPLTQVELADFLALTPVHVNRCLAALRHARLASLRHGMLEVNDLSALEQFAHADSDAVCVELG